MKINDLIAECRNRIDVIGLSRVHGVYPKSVWNKFFDFENFLPIACNHALRFDEELQPGSRAIDVGCGFGYVALALEVLGHTCVAWDTPSPVLRNVAHMIPVRERNFKVITREMDSPELLADYDLILLHGVWPMRDAGGWWELPDYVRLAAGLGAGLKPGGRMEILVNRGDELPKICNWAAWKLAVDEYTTVAIDDNCITFRRHAPVAV